MPHKTASKQNNFYPTCNGWSGESISKKKCSRHVMFKPNLWKALKQKAQNENKSISYIIEELLLKSLSQGGQK